MQRDLGIPKRRLLQFRLEDTDRLLYREGQSGSTVRGSARSPRACTVTGSGHRLAWAMCGPKEPITAQWIAAQRFEIEIGWERYAARAQPGAVLRSQGRAGKVLILQ